MGINFEKLDYGIPAGSPSLDNLIEVLISSATKEDVRTSFGKHSRAYLSTNEWHQAVLDNVDFKNKRVLGVTGSADFMLSSINKGAREFVGVDISLLSCLFAELKIAGLRNLSHEQFTGFFVSNEPDDPRAFSINTYETKLRNDLSTVAKAFFDKIIGNTYQHSFPGRVQAAMPLAYAFFTISDDSYDLQAETHYLSSPEHFYHTKRQLANSEINLVRGDLLEKIRSEDSVKGKFDIIYTSNIHDYASLKPSAMMNVVNQRLNPGGKIIFFPFVNKKDEIREELNSSGFETKEYYPVDMPFSLVPALLSIGYVAWKNDK